MPGSNRWVRGWQVPGAALVVLCVLAGGARAQESSCGGRVPACARPRVAVPVSPPARLLGLLEAPRPGASSPVASWDAAQLATLDDAPRATLEAAAEALLDGGRAAPARRLLERLGQDASDAQNCLYEAWRLDADRLDGTLRPADLGPWLDAQQRRLAALRAPPPVRLPGALAARGVQAAELCAAASLEAGASAAAWLHRRALTGDRDAGRAASSAYDALTWIVPYAPASSPRLPASLWPTVASLAASRGALAHALGAWEECAHAFRLAAHATPSVPLAPLGAPSAAPPVASTSLVARVSPALVANQTPGPLAAASAAVSRPVPRGETRPATPDPPVAPPPPRAPAEVALEAADAQAARVFAGRCEARRVEATTPPLTLRGEFRASTAPPPRAFSASEQQALDSIDEAACLDLDEGPLRLAAARLELAAGRPAEATAELRALVDRLAPADRATTALVLVEVAGRAGDEACVAEAGARLRQVSGEVCGGKYGASLQSACAALDRLDPEVARAQARLLRARAAAGALDAAGLHELAGLALHDAARRCALDPLEQRRRAACEHPDELLWDAAEAFAAGRRPLKSIRVLLLLLDPRYRLQRTAAARRAVLAIARAHESLANHEEAASWYEKFATEYPADPDTAQALAQAVTLRLALDQEPEAARGVAELRAWRGPPTLAVASALALVDHHVRRAAWESASGRLGESWRFVQDHGTPADRVVAHALRGRIRHGLGLPADAEFTRTLDLWTRAGRPSDPASLDAVARAELHALARLVDRAAALRAPVLHEPGRPTEPAMRRHLAGPLTRWLTQRRTLVETIERAADTLATHDPPLPDEHVATARALAFDAWLALEREASSPRWTGLPGFLPPVQRALDTLLDSSRERTTSAGWACLRGAVQGASFDDRTTRCERWLADHAGVHLIDESLLPRPSLTGAPLVFRPAP